MNPLQPDFQLLARADLLLLIRDLLTPSAHWLEPVDGGVGGERLRELVSAAGLDASDDQLPRVLHEVASLSAEDRRLCVAEHNRLFEGPVLCPINESAYVRRDKGAILADLCGFYRAFGFEPSRDTGEKADHLTNELEFLAVLLAMLQQSRTPEQAQVTADAIQAYCRDHLTEWVPSFCAQLGQLTGAPQLRAAALMLQSLWSQIAQELGLSAICASDMVKPDDGTPYDCGMDGASGTAVELTVRSGALK